jgi:CheY-like chemotaxis protein
MDESAEVDETHTRLRVRGNRVLCVDDDPLVCRMLVRRLTRIGYVAATASSATEALGILGGPESFDAMLTDYRMPGTTGLELSRQAVAAYPTLVVFLLTGLEPPSEANLSEYGIAVVISKPFSFEELAQKLEGMLRREFVAFGRRSA